MTNTSTPERFPILSHFLFGWIGVYAASAAIYLWLSPLPPRPVINTALARIVVATGLPASSIIPIPLQPGGRFEAIPASRYLDVQSREPALKSAADWLVWWLPASSFFIVSASTYLFYRRKKNLKVLRGTTVVFK